jgi:hypothetical protein
MVAPTKGGVAMDRDARKLRRTVARLQEGQARTAVRYPGDLRQRVMAFARRRQRQGADVTAIAREVGVAPWTLALWLRRPVAAHVRAVDVVPDAVPVAGGPEAGPVLITPRGFRVEGLDRDGLVALLRALA